MPDTIETEPVECLSSVSYADYPLAVHWQGERLMVKQILSRKRTPQTIWFRVMTSSTIATSNELIFDLSYDLINDQWEIQLR